MRRLLGRAVLAGAVALLALGPAGVSAADEPVTTAPAAGRTPRRCPCHRPGRAGRRAGRGPLRAGRVVGGDGPRGRRPPPRRPGAAGSPRHRRAHPAAAGRCRAPAGRDRTAPGRGPGPADAQRPGGRADRGPGHRAAGPARPAGPRRLPGRRLAQQRLDAARLAVPLGLRRAHRRHPDRRDVAALADRRPGDRSAVLRRPHRRPRAGPRRRRRGRRAGPARTCARCSELSKQAREAEARVNGLVAQRKAALAAAAAAQAEDDIAHAQRVGESSQLQAQLAAQAARRPGSGRQPATGPPSRPGAGTLGWPVHGGHHLAVRDAGAPGDRGLQAAHRCRHRGRVRHADPRRPRPASSCRPGGTAPTAGAPSSPTVPSTECCSPRRTTTRPSSVSRSATGSPPGRPSARWATTGYSTGCHLHLELYVNAALVDPVPWLPAF